MQCVRKRTRVAAIRADLAEINHAGPGCSFGHRHAAVPLFAWAVGEAAAQLASGCEARHRLRKFLNWRHRCLRRTTHVRLSRPVPWERFITPSIIKLFYWLAVGISALFGLSGIVSGLALMALSPLAGLFWILASLIGVVIGVIFARIIAEFVLIMFRINEHLGAIRQRGQQL